MTKQEIIETLIFAIKTTYGINNNGCYVNGEWLSTEAIIEIIKDTIKYDIYL